MPNDQPGTWWNVEYQIVPMELTTIQTAVTSNLLSQGDQIRMTYPTASSGGDFMFGGGANFTFASNVTGITLYPANPQESIIISTQINHWNFVGDTLKVNFSLYENVPSGGPTTPPYINALITYNSSTTIETAGDPSVESGPFVELIQGDGAYLMGITSGQIAEITNSVNQSLAVPISQLNAAVTSINGDVANLQTSFGKMTVLLSTINATVSSVENGQVSVLTSLGTVSTSLSSLDASIISVNWGLRH